MALTEHQTNDCNKAIEITHDEPDPKTGAPRRYQAKYGPGRHDHTPIILHHGNPKDGVNGITLEVLFAIAADRLRGLQKGPRACPANDEALRGIAITQAALAGRTQERTERGVEGTQEA